MTEKQARNLRLGRTADFKHIPKFESPFEAPIDLFGNWQSPIFRNARSARTI